MTNEKIQLVLGSASPRRQELLKYTFCPFKIITAEVDEVSDEKEIGAWVECIAQKKACAVFELAKKQYTNPLVLSSDTIVVKDGIRLGKPVSRDDAKRMLLSLSGKSHQVLTGVCLKSLTREKRFHSVTEVIFDEINEELLELYLDTGEAFDKAGSYGIQAYGLAFVNTVIGSYSNVVGLPVNQVIRELETFVKQDYSGEDWRQIFER